MSTNHKEPAHMWKYWRDKKGLEEALTEYFPNTLAKNPQLQQALAQFRNAEKLINTIMLENADEEDDE